MREDEPKLVEFRRRLGAEANCFVGSYAPWPKPVRNAISLDALVDEVLAGVAGEWQSPFVLVDRSRG